MAERENTGVLLGVDLGGTKIEAAILDRDGRFLSRQRAPNPGGYAPTVAAIKELCARSERDCGLPSGELALGIGTPGSMSPRSGLMRNCNSTALNGRDLPGDLEQATGRPVRLANDADCFALSETRDGAAAGAGSVFAVILGTGVGGGVTVDGRLAQGANGVAGEWGHNRLPLERCRALPAALGAGRRLCYCGRHDCIETWLSGPGLAQTHRDLHGEDIDDEALRSGDPGGLLEDTLAVYSELAGAALAGVVNILDPEVLVLGGGLSNVQYLYRQLPETVSPHVFSDVFATPIRPAMHGDSSGVRGAAWLWRDEPGEND